MLHSGCGISQHWPTLMLHWLRCIPTLSDQLWWYTLAVVYPNTLAAVYPQHWATLILHSGRLLHTHLYYIPSFMTNIFKYQPHLWGHFFLFNQESTGLADLNACRLCQEFKKVVIHWIHLIETYLQIERLTKCAKKRWKTNPAWYRHHLWWGKERNIRSSHRIKWESWELIYQTRL